VFRRRSLSILASSDKATSVQLKLLSSRHILHLNRVAEGLHHWLFPKEASHPWGLGRISGVYVALVRASQRSDPNQGRTIYPETYKHSV